MRIFLSLLFLSLVAFGCGPKATVKTVEGYPEQANRGEDKSVLSTVSGLPTTLRMGELNKIENLDPLFVNNSSTRRLIPMIYEGLVKLDENDQISPSLAKRWEYSEDSLTVTFILNRRFFQNDPAFNNGLGRKVNSFDVKRCFERMAFLEVPPNAARLFINHVRGFDAFFREQHEVFDEDQRRLSEIVGIQTPTDSTIRFILSNNDADFLNKLASPFAVVYPDEVVKKYDKGLAKHPVGTGLFSLERFTADTLISLQKNKEHPLATDVFLDRVEILALDNEATLYKRLASGKIHFIPRMGPLMLKTLVNDQGELIESFRTEYMIGDLTNQQRVNVNLNTSNYDGLTIGQTKALFDKFDVSIISRAVGEHNFTFTSKLGQISSDASVFTQFSNSAPSAPKIVLSFDGDQDSKFYGRIIGNSLAPFAGIRLIQSQIVSSDIHVYLENSTVLYPNQLYSPQSTTNKTLAVIETRRSAVFSKSVSGIKFNSMDWWMDLSGVKISFESVETTADL